MPTAASVPVTEQLLRYKQLIDTDIATYAAHVAASTRREYGVQAAEVTDVFLDMLQRGGKRIRGALVMAGYEMCGGTDQAMIMRAATAIEMLHAYMLIVDDIQDRSTVRRGRPTAHIMLADYHHKQSDLQGDADHAGVSLALDAALAGAHAAQMLLSGLSVDAELRLKVLGIVNQALVVTSHGQTLDILNQLRTQPHEDDVRKAMEWKTTYYTFLNPLCTGMVLAGAECTDTDAIRDFALNTGRAFQITDDIIGIYGDDAKTGKVAMDDIREGKQTILTTYALDHASSEDAAFLRSQLGNSRLTVAQFRHCQQIITDSGARDHAMKLAADYVARAVGVLDTAPPSWQADRVAFLRNLANLLLTRVA